MGFSAITLVVLLFHFKYVVWDNLIDGSRENIRRLFKTEETKHKQCWPIHKKVDVSTTPTAEDQIPPLDFI